MEPTKISTAPTPPRSLTRGYTLAITGTAIWSTTAILIGYLSTHFALPPLVLAFWRDLFAASALWLGLRLFQPRALFPPGLRRHLPFLALYGVILAGFNALWTTSVAMNGAAVGTVLAYSAPAFTGLLGWRLFGEKINLPKVAALVLSIAGCILVSGAYQLSAWRAKPLGITVGLIAGLAFAAYSLMGKAAARRGLSGWTSMCYAFSFAALFLLFLQRPSTFLWLGSNAAGWGVLALLAIGPTIAGYGLYSVSLEYLPASVASLITPLEPPLTALQAFVFLHETMTGPEFVGAGLILSSVFLLRVGEKPGPVISQTTEG